MFSNDSGEIITETLALPSDKVHLGISNEYAQNHSKYVNGSVYEAKCHSFWYLNFQYWWL